METITLNCPTFCELLPCSVGLVLGLDSAFPGGVGMCPGGGGVGGRLGKKQRGPVSSEGQQEGPRFHSGSSSPPRYRGAWCLAEHKLPHASSAGGGGGAEETHCLSE